MARRCISDAIAIAALLIIDGTAEAAPGDYVRLSAGGIMTAGLEISIDLDTGAAVKKAMPRRSPASGEQPNWQETRKQLTPEELKNLTDTIRLGLKEGFKSRECIDQEEAARKSGKRPPMRPPSMDSITSLDVRLGGQSAYAPGHECESPAVGRVWEAVYNAAG